jgi:type I restriction enzyme S subunit
MPQGYKQTELGIIPEDWEIMTFDELGTFSKGSGVSRAESNTGNIPCIRYGELYTHHNDYIKAYNSYVSKTVASKAKLLQYGDVLFAASGETKEEIGKSAAFVNSCEAYAGGDIIILSTNSKLCDAKYIGYASNAPYVTKQKATKGQGDAVVHITSEAIKTISINIPPIAEQRAIAEALSDVDGLIAALDNKIAKKRHLKQGAMQQLLTGKKRLPGFTDEWVSVQLKEICSFQNGYTPSKTVRHFWENGTVPWFRMEDIRTNGRILNHAIQHVTNAAVKGDLFPAGSIIMSTTATIGEHALLIVDSLANQQFTNLIIRKSLDKQVDTMWFYHYCYILGEWCRNNINDGGLAAVNMDDFSNVHITLPPILEQQAIATILSDMDKEIADLEAQRDKYRLLKSGMMQKLLTGQIRFKNE